MHRTLFFGIVLLGLASCEGSTLTAPSRPGTSSGGPTDPDRPDTGEWGDPSTTRLPDKLRMAQLNVRRYFDATCDSGKCAEGGFEEAPTAADFAERTTEIATGIAKLKADIITLSEVENENCLAALQEKLREAGADYPVAHLAETGAPGSIDVAVLARGKLASVKKHRADNPLTRPDGSRTTFTRELPEVRLTLGDHTVIVFAAHFRSKADDDPGRRVAEAQKAQEIIVASGKANPSALLLLGGDLNDVPGSEAIAALEKDGALVRVARDIPTTAQGTHTYGGQSEAIDHIFTTKASASSYVPLSATVMRDDGSGFAGSDHGALYADFDLSE